VLETGILSQRHADGLLGRGRVRAVDIIKIMNRREILAGTNICIGMEV
jgi:hypothetical protein